MGFERFLLPPFRMLWRERLHPVQHEAELEIEGLLRPERAVIIEDGDAVFGLDEAIPTLGRDFRHEIDDGLAGFSRIPGRQAVGQNGQWGEQHDEQGAKDEVHDRSNQGLGLLMQRKPTWLVEVSSGSAWRAAGR